MDLKHEKWLVLQSKFKGFKERGIKDPIIEVAQDRIILSSSIINSSIIADLILICVSGYLLIKAPFEFSLLNYIMLLLSIGLIWRDFEDINIITINKNPATIIITTKNKLKSLFFSKQDIIALNEISFFEVEVTNPAYAYRRYRIKAILNDKKYAVINTVQNQTNGEMILSALNYFII